MTLGRSGMYKTIWDGESGGILLVESSNDTVKPPRPVFHEELNLLGFDKFWEYPCVEEPLLWNIGRRYYYKGRFVAEAIGGGIFEKAQIKVRDEGRALSLEPVDVKLMIEKNRKAIEILKNEAIDFINDTFTKYKNRVDQVIVSYSGGKDSQVILDLVSRTLSPDEYIVVFTDTTMELPATYKIYEETKAHYERIYPSLKFYTAQNEQHSLELWKTFGPPSRILRWCCTVYKTSPQVKLIKALNPEKEGIKILVFDGVRANESVRRSGYERVSTESKHIAFTNAHPIITWNTAEIFIYALSLRDKETDKFFINAGYRSGLQRVGCSICPFSSPWSEFVLSQTFPELADSYIEIIKQHVKSLGLRDDSEIKKYIAQGSWKKRIGAEGIDREDVNVNIFEEGGNFEAVISKPRENISQWIKALGPVDCTSSNGITIYNMKFNNSLYELEVSEADNNKLIISSNHGTFDKTFSSRLEKVIYKTAYCTHCGACEAECYSGALTVVPKVSINENKCVHCLSCLDFVEKGCLLAKSILNVGGNKMVKNRLTNFNRYFTFGMRSEWLRHFLVELTEWYSKNTLGSIQLTSMIRWLKDAELIDQKKVPTHLALTLNKLVSKDEALVDQIVWINLFYNSSVIRWYLERLKWGTTISFKELYNILLNEEQMTPKTASSGLNSLINMFENMPTYEKMGLGIVEKIGKERYVRKVGGTDVHPVAVLYSLYRFAIFKNKYRLTVSELYDKENKDGGPYLVFGMEKEAFENTLRWLQENTTGLIKVDLIAGLDNINLQEDINDYGKLFGVLTTSFNSKDIRL